MAQVILTEASGTLKELFGEIQAPLASIVMDMANATEAKSIARKIFTERKSTNSIEAYGSLTAVDSFAPVGENGAYPTGGFESGYFQEMRNQTWKGSFAISREAHDDVKAIDLTKVPSSFFSDYERKFERFFAALMGNAIQGNTSFDVNGFTFSTKSADGVAQFSKNHKMKVKGTNQSNVFAGAFGKETLNKLITMMQNVKDDNNNTMSLIPDTLIIPNLPDLKDAAFAVLGSNKDPNTANNAFNALFATLNIIVWPTLNDYIGTEAPFILMDSGYNKTADGAVFQNRVPLEIRDSLGDNDEYLWKGYSRFTGGFVDFRAMFVGGVSTGSVFA